MIDFWSHTDFTYECLADRRRVEVFDRAIRAVVRGGETIVDVGAGSGILGLLAARAGARKVYAVELEPMLAETLRSTVHANRLDSVIEVVECDAVTADLPLDVDLVIAELIETWLLDEAQVPVINALRARGVIGPNARVLPERYDALMELVRWDNSFYGFKIAHPKHAWPHYDDEDRWWLTDVAPTTSPLRVFSVDFGAEVVSRVSAEIESGPIGSGTNAVRLSGEITLTSGVTVSATPSLNSPKTLLLNADLAARLGGTDGQQRLRVTAELGGGLGSFALRAVTDL